MRLAIFSIVLALGMSGCASQPIAVINAAADAVGDAAGIKAVNTLVIEGTGENFNLGQSVRPDAPLPKLTVTSSKRSIDYMNSRWRLEQARTPTYVTANTTPNQPQILGIDGDVAYNVPATGPATRAAEQVAQDRHSELFHHPIGALRAALDDGAKVTNQRKEGNDDVVDVEVGKDKFTLYVDSTTKLPSRVVTMTYNANLGDVALTTEFGMYGESDGMTLPGKITSKTDKYLLADIQGTREPIKVDVDVRVGEAMLQLVANTSGAELDRLASEFDEYERFWREHHPDVIDAVGEDVTEKKLNGAGGG